MRAAVLVVFTVFCSAVWCNAPASAPSVPLRIEKNAGQIRSAVDGAPVEYLARGGGYVIALTSRGMQLQSRAGQGDLTVTFPGSNGKALAPLDPLPLRVNYYNGTDPSRYVANAATWAKLRYQEMYPGIDLILHQDAQPSAQQWEYDFSVAPGADPARIAFEIGSAKSLRLEANGDLLAESMDGAVVRWRKPAAYQDGADGARQIVESSFVLHGRRVSFRLGRWDHTRRLVVDPAVVYSVYFGGMTRDGARGIAIDPSGNIYIAGGSNSGDLPTNKSSYQPAYAGSSLDNFGDAFVARFNSSGTPTYVTYFGGSGDDEATTLAVDSSGSVYIAGTTNSLDLPRMNPAQANFGGSGTTGGNAWWGGVGDAFAAKFNSSGGLVYSTYLGGNQDDGATGIAVDSTGAAYIAGATMSPGLFVSAPGFQKTWGGSPNQFINATGYPTINLGDAFVAKLSPSGSQVVGFTYLGGMQDDGATTVTLDPSGNVWVGGCTNSNNFPTRNPYLGGNQGLSPGALQPFANCGDGFLSELSSNLQTLMYSTYFGGNGDDAVTSLYVDSTGTVYMAGLTLSTNFPLKNPVQSTYHGPTTLTNDGTYGDAFLARLNPATNTLLFSTYLGGSANDAAAAMAVDPTGAVFIVGTAQSADFPLMGALQTTMAGTGGMESTGDAFVAKIDPVAGKLLYSSYLGGEKADGALGVVIDAAGNVIVLGETESPNFPVAAASQTVGGQSPFGGVDTFLTKISGLTTGPGIGGVGNVASYANNAVAPGEVVVVFGTNIGPATLTSVTALDPSTGLIPTELANAEVLFDGVPAPLVYVSALQTCAVVPYGVAGKTSTQIQVSYNGSLSGVFTMPVAAAVPGLFSANSSGTGQGAIYNQDGTPNSASNPAAQNTIVTFFGTGQGVLNPPVPDGTLESTATLPSPAAPVTVTFDGIPAASIAYKGPIPDLVVGFWQIDTTLPALSSGTHQLSVTVGGVASQSNLTIAVK